MIYNVYGSASSIDADVAVIVNKYLNFKNKFQIQQLRQQYIKQLHTQFDKELNVNLVKVKDGIIYETFVGIPDELNNAIFYTYNYHTQTHQLFVKRVVERNIKAKVERIPMVILTYLSRFQPLRPKIKAALRSQNFQTRIETINEVINHRNINEYLINIETFKKMPLSEVAKKIVFQVRQTIYLINGIEIYTKEEAIDLAKDQVEIEVLKRRATEKDAAKYVITIVKEFLDTI